jgi:GGDEF domain-containing protein
LRVPKKPPDPDDEIAVAQGIQQFGAAAELHGLRRELENNLHILEDEYDQRRQELDRLTTTLRDRLTIMEQAAHYQQPELAAVEVQPPPPAVDRCTGLPTKPDAEIAIRRCLAGQARTYIVVLYLHRLAATNARSGEAVGDRMLQFCSEHLTAILAGPQDSVFRWRGAAFLALLERDEALPAVSRLANRLCAPQSRFIELPTRTVFLPLKLTSAVIAVNGRTETEIVQEIEDYVARVSESG